MKDQILELLRHFSQGADIPGDDDSLFDAGALDSFALADFVAALEQKFGISVPKDDLRPRKFETVNKIIEYVETRKN